MTAGGSGALGLAALCAFCATGAAADPAILLLAELGRGDAAVAQSMIERALESAASGQSLEWRRDQPATEMLVTPVRTFRIETGHFCRDFHLTLRLGDRRRDGDGVACRGPAGGWVVVPPAP